MQSLARNKQTFQFRVLNNVWKVSTKNTWNRKTSGKIKQTYFSWKGVRADKANKKLERIYQIYQVLEYWEDRKHSEKKNFQTHDDLNLVTGYTYIYEDRNCVPVKTIKYRNLSSQEKGLVNK